jgi:hypothetical protein
MAVASKGIGTEEISKLRQQNNHNSMSSSCYSSSTATTTEILATASIVNNPYDIKVKVTLTVHPDDDDGEACDAADHTRAGG